MDLTALGSDPVQLGVRVAVAVAGAVVFARGQQQARTPERIAGVIIALAPLAIVQPSQLLGFVGGVGLGLWMLRRVS